MNKAKKYFMNDRHQYMSPAQEALASFVFSEIEKGCSLNEKAVAIEIGAGMGRFSSPLIRKFDKVFLVEPVSDYCDGLKDKFRNFPCVEVVNSSAADFFQRNPLEGVGGYVFCFHVLHHLDDENRRNLYEGLKSSGAVGVFVEPNSFNPLILAQILMKPEMKLAEEKNYLTLTLSRLGQELESSGLQVICRKYICPLPPGMMNWLLSVPCKKWQLGFEKIASWLPFINSYQLTICRHNVSEKNV